VITEGESDVSAHADLPKLEALLQMLQTDPANTALRSDCVRVALAIGEPERAQQIVDARLKEVPTDPHALFDSVNVLIARKEYRNALVQLDALLAMGYRQPGILINSGLCHYCVGEFSAAQVVLKEAYGAGDRSAGALRLLISTMHHLAMLDEAVEIADANAEVASTDGPLAGVFALLYLDAELPAPAARWARTALKLNPNSVDGLVVEGMLHITQIRTDDAERQFRHALELAPATGRAWLGLGTLALLAKDLKSAKDLIETALKHLGEHVGTYHVLGWTHLAMGDLASAESVFQSALALNRNFAETHGALATIAAFRGNRQDAERSIAIAERLDEDCLSAKLAGAILAGGNNAALTRRIVAETAGTLASKDSSALSRLLGSISKH
jgi:tetratricopeptide (TPR) repeat protein